MMTQEEMKTMIGKLCKEQGITQDELLNFFVSNKLISWMRENKKRMVNEKVWKENIRIPRRVSMERIKKKRGKKSFQIPNIFKLAEQQRQLKKYLGECIVYVCPNCNAKIERHPTNKGSCPLCKAPYQFDMEKTMKWFMK